MEAPRQITFSDIYQCVADPEIGLSGDISRALKDDLGLKRDFDRLLEKTSIYRFPRVAAASSGAPSQRQGDGFSIQIRPSKANPAHIYILIDITGDMVPASLFVCGVGSRYQKYSLPEVHDGSIQILVESDCELVRALNDLSTEVFLK